MTSAPDPDRLAAAEQRLRYLADNMSEDTPWVCQGIGDIRDLRDLLDARAERIAELERENAELRKVKTAAEELAAYWESPTDYEPLEGTLLIDEVCAVLRALAGEQTGGEKE